MFVYHQPQRAVLPVKEFEVHLVDADVLSMSIYMTAMAETTNPLLISCRSILFDILLLSYSLRGRCRASQTNANSHSFAGRLPVRELSELVWIVWEHLEHLELTLEVPLESQFMWLHKFALLNCVQIRVKCYRCLKVAGVIKIGDMQNRSRGNFLFLLKQGCCFTLLEPLSTQ